MLKGIKHSTVTREFGGGIYVDFRMPSDVKVLYYTILTYCSYMDPQSIRNGAHLLLAFPSHVRITLYHSHQASPPTPVLSLIMTATPCLWPCSSCHNKKQDS
jgi:hypothetical protein